MFCPNCGKENRDNASFCSECGTKLNAQIRNNDDSDNYNTNVKANITAKRTDNKLKLVLILVSALLFISILIGLVFVILGKKQNDVFYADYTLNTYSVLTFINIKETDIVKLSVEDEGGKRHLEKELTKENPSVEIKLPNGNYYFRMNYNDNEFVHNVIIDETSPNKSSIIDPHDPENPVIKPDEKVLKPDTTAETSKKEEAAAAKIIITEKATSQPKKSDKPSLKQAYYDVLMDVHDNMDKYNRPFSVEGNQFAIKDIDGDGVEELVVSFFDAPVAGQCAIIWRYDTKTNKAQQLSTAVRAYADFYKNGYIADPDSHNQSMNTTIWPYVLKKINGNNLDTLYGVSCMDIYKYEDYDSYKQYDSDEDGVLYRLDEGGYSEDKGVYYTLDEYNSFVNKYIPESNKINMDYKYLTMDNIKKVIN